jgi:hypothetical protein
MGLAPLPASSGADAPVVDEDVGGGIEGYVTVLDPGEIREKLVEGEAFDMPVVEGEVTIDEAERRGTIEYTDVAENGSQEEVSRPSNLWEITTQDDDREGVVFSVDHSVRAWIDMGDYTSFVEPVQSEIDPDHPDRAYKIYRLSGDSKELLQDGFDEVRGSEEDSAVNGSGDDIVRPTGHVQVYKTIYAYVDTEYRNQYGSCCWADQVDYILTTVSNWIDDVELWYNYGDGEVDPDFDTKDIDQAWDTLTSKSRQGEDVRTHWSYKDFDGCTIGLATEPGWSKLIQHAPDNCHGNSIPDNDAERAYLSTHEFGHNNNAAHDYHWSDTTWYGHEHRSFMDGSAWGHYHECWSQTNMNRMANHLGTSAVGDAC